METPVRDKWVDCDRLSVWSEEELFCDCDTSFDCTCFDELDEEDQFSF